MDEEAVATVNRIAKAWRVCSFSEEEGHSEGACAATCVLRGEGGKKTLQSAVTPLSYHGVLARVNTADVVLRSE
jgi:hypothetical protein